VCGHLARELVHDGEGVTHACEVIVKGAKTQEEAQRLCRHISSSMLFKTMLAGGDPNWGRIMGSVGASGVSFSQLSDIAFDGVPILKNGAEVIRNKQRLRQILRKKEFRLEVNLKKGKFSEQYWTTDLTKFYVWINSRYST
jgi:glutamate N-acetyltransferase/amino-acid N-acetyltransferase